MELKEEYKGFDFNPRSRKGSDVALPSYLTGMQYFNPRSRKGSDQKNGVIGFNFEISIHAPAKGATYMPMFLKMMDGKFQSTLPQRERRHDLENERHAIKFQSTLPQRERQYLAKGE